ncbi:hypothetical protein N2152v2_003692 [Parachlorella kessleri]
MASAVDTVVQTVLASQQITATPQQRAAAVQLFEQLKAGELHSSTSIGAELIKAHQPVEVQVMGYTLLQHLVGTRWDEFTKEEQTQLATLSYNMLKEVGGLGGAWAARSKASVLLALVIKRSGAELWEAALPQLIAVAAEGPVIQASGGQQGLRHEEVCMVMRYVADEVTQYADDIQAEVKRLLLAVLTKSLAQVLPFLERTLEHNFAAAGAASQAGQREVAQQHVAAVQAALGAVLTYAEWAPLMWLKQAGLIGACGFLLGTLEFRDTACEVLRLVAGRKQTQDDSPEVFQEVTAQLADALSAAAAPLLAPAAAAELDYDGAADEFGRQLCEGMASLAPHFSAVSDPSRRLAFLQQMLAFAQHPYLLLADKALPFWVKLLQDGASAAAAASNPGKAGSNPSVGSVGNGLQAGPASPPLQPEAVTALMEMAAEQLQKRGAHTPQEQEDFPAYFDTFPEYKEFVVNYRSKLSAVVRCAAALLPEQALMAAARRLEAAAVACARPAGAQQLEEARGLLESAVYFMESTFKAVWDDSLAQQPAKLQAMVAVSEPMLQRVLGIQSQGDAIVLQHQARGLESFGRLLGARPDLLPAAISRVLELLVGVVPLEAPGQQPPPGKPAAGWREGLQARQSVGMVLLAWAKETPAAFLPHLEGLATRVKELWEGGLVRAGERNVISEAILGAAVAGPQQLQLSVVEWVLSPVRADWAQPVFQATLASPQAFITHYLPLEADPAGGYQVGGQLPRWQLYHQVHLLERAVRRMPGAGGPGGESHPIAPHASWALPVMLRIITCIHAVYTSAGRQMLAPVAPVLEMSPMEKALYLKKGAPGRSNKVSDDDSDGDYASVGGTTVGSIRAWLRHIREFLYQTLGLLPTHCPAALGCAPAQAVFAPAVFSYVESLPHPQLRIVLRHILIPHIKSCPPRHLAGWVAPALALLAPHMHTRLTEAWGGMQHHALAGPSKEDSASADEEIIRDRLLRELTQEYAMLLQEVSSRRLDDPAGTAQQQQQQQQLAASQASGRAGAGGTAAMAGTAGAAAAATPAQGGGGKSLLEWEMEQDAGTGFAMLTTAVAGMCWRDESAFRFAMFCRTMVALAPRDQRLYSYVGGEMLQAAIASLASEALATHQTDMLSLLRGILVQQVNDGASAAPSVLLSLPGMTPDKLEAFRKTLFGTGSEKAQRDAIKRLLLEACGKASFAGLADWKPPSAVVMSAPKLRAPKSPAKDQIDVYFQQIFH